MKEQAIKSAIKDTIELAYIKSFWFDKHDKFDKEREAMNRLIKFRAWHKIQKRIFEVYGINKHFVFEESYNDYLDSIYTIDDIILMQCTGLKDKNGIDIYEGDIIKIISKNFIGSVKFKNLSFIVENKEKQFYYINDILVDLFYEVMGNIYENDFY